MASAFFLLINQVVAPEAAHPFCKENIIILIIFHVQVLQAWGGLPARQGKARSNSTTKPVASHCSANKRKQTHGFNHSFCTPSPKPVPLQPQALSKHKVSPFSSLFNKVSFNLSVAAMSNMTLLQGVGGRAAAAACAAAECPSCQYQCRIAHSYMPAGGRPKVGLWFLRSRIDILMLVRSWHSCLQRPGWLCGREHKWPALPLLLSPSWLLLSLLFLQCSRNIICLDRNTSWSNCSLIFGLGQRVQSAFHLSNFICHIRGMYGRPCLAWMHSG